MVKYLFIMLTFAFSGYGYANKVTHAKISGDSYLGFSGASVKITMNNEHCSISSTGNEFGGELEMILTCSSVNQFLWSKEDGFTDEPGFRLIKAGDFDNDGKIDLEMEMSPKYSCNQQIIYLSSKASSNQLVGISKASELICGG